MKPRLGMVLTSFIFALALISTTIFEDEYHKHVYLLNLVHRHPTTGMHLILGIPIASNPFWGNALWTSVIVAVVSAVAIVIQRRNQRR